MLSLTEFSVFKLCGCTDCDSDRTDYDFAFDKNKIKF